MRRNSILEALPRVLKCKTAHRCPHKKDPPKGARIFEVPKKARAVLALAEGIRARAERIKHGWVRSRKTALADALTDLACQDIRAHYDRSEHYFIEWYSGWRCAFVRCP